MDEASRRSQTAKGGPRALTVTPDAVDIDGTVTITAAVFNNCPECDPPANYVFWDEDLTVGERDLFVHGWYSIETDINIFWQQVNPRDACTTDPARTGRRLTAGQCAAFFVDMSQMDGVIVIAVCEQAFPEVVCGDIPDPFEPVEFTEGLIRFNRVDTILKMSETGDNASLMVSQPSPVCGSPVGP